MGLDPAPTFKPCDLRPIPSLGSHLTELFRKNEHTDPGL